MGRSVSGVCTAALLCASLVWTGCGSNPSGNGNNPPPAFVSLSPTPDVSLELGGTQSFTATVRNNRQIQLNLPIFFQSTNPAVVTVASNGLACAGTWDSLSNPQICTPGIVGTAAITAVSKGVSSPPTTVHVHDHIDHITITPVTIPTPSCLSRTQISTYQASAFNQGRDITATVGDFSWQSNNTNVVTLSTTASGLLPGQVQATANVPGTTTISASVSGTNSSPISFETCAVQSIKLRLANSDDTSFTVSSGSKPITATVLDTQGTDISGVQLTWSTSDSATVTVSTSGSASATGKGGSATIIASCLPNAGSPGCNLGFQPSQAIYPQNIIRGTVIPSSTTTTPSTTAVLVSSTGCGTDDNCVTEIVPIDVTKNVPAVPADLPGTPDSLLFNRTGANAFLGADKGLLGTRGLMVVVPSNAATTAPAVSQLTTAPGRILAVSPAGKLVVADTPDSPTVAIVDGAASPPSATLLPIVNANAADFSPDGFRTYIAAGNKLYVFSTQEALKTIAVAGTPNAISFLPIGAFAYVSGEQAGKITVRKTCDNTIARDAAGTQQILSLASTPQFLKALPDNSAIAALDSPGTSISLISVDTTPEGCQPPSGTLPGGLPVVTHGPVASFNLGHGTLDIKQVLFSSDSTKAYIVAANLGTIAVFHFDSKAVSGIQLAGNTLPIQAGITTDGKVIYVIAADDTVHVLDTVTESDTAQIAFPDGLCHAKDNVSQKIPCKPDLIAVKP
jgi:hypothetical protein